MVAVPCFETLETTYEATLDHTAAADSFIVPSGLPQLEERRMKEIGKVNAAFN
jgi:hypothetical protein